MNFKKWINETFEAETLMGRCALAADHLGCSFTTAERLYYGYQPRNIKMYERLAVVGIEK